jgi:sRNA-binding protein
LTLALAHYCNNKMYLAHMRAGATRLDLDGNPAGVATAEAAQAATEKLGTRLLRAPARKKPAPSAQAVVPAPAGARRLTLRDLKDLAVLRRQASPPRS